MIIFNLFAVPIVLLVGAIGAGLVWLMPSVFGGPYTEVTYAVLAIGIGGLGELVGLRGRLFFLPIWLIGGGVLAWQLWGLFGTTGLIAGGGLLALLTVAFAATVVVMLAGQDKTKGKRLEEARAAFAKPDLEEARMALADAWVIPAFGKVQADRAKHLLEVLGLLEQHADALALNGDARALGAAVRGVLTRVADGGAPISFTSDEAVPLHEMGKAIETPDFELSSDVRQTLAKLA